MRTAAVRAFGASVVFVTLACSRAPADLESFRAAVINGEDDRLQAFEVPAALREPLLGASAALIFAHHLIEHDIGSVSLSAPVASAALGLCEDERFANEPVAAFCSGVLIDDDLVATAGHCFGSSLELASGRCRSTRIAFGYALPASDAGLELGAERVFACRKVVALDADIAVVQLDRPAPGASPRPVASASPEAGDALIVASHGAGLPLKIELAAELSEVAPESGTLTVAMDTFAGSSGGGLYNQDLELVGLVEDGALDWEGVDGCTRAAHSGTPRERAVSARRLTDMICGADWPSPRFCDTPPICGDAICNGVEAAACAGDCPVPRCGDDLCEPAERGACRRDCARYAGVPASWMDNPENYPRPLDPVDAAPASNGCAISRTSNASHTPPWLALLLTLTHAVHLRRMARARHARPRFETTPSSGFGSMRGR